MPPALEAASEAADPEAAESNALALQAVRAILAEERERAARRLPTDAADWRFLLALYEAELNGRALTPEDAAEAAAAPPETTCGLAQNFESQDFLLRQPGGTLRLTDHACGYLALWVSALHPLPGFNPYRAAAGAPHPMPPPEPPAWLW